MSVVVRSSALSSKDYSYNVAVLVAGVKDKHRKHQKSGKMVYSVFQKSYIHKNTAMKITKSDNLWSHIGKLVSPLEILIQNRFPITDIVHANDLIVSRAYNGLCAAYNNWSNEFICYLNTGEGETIRSIFFNQKRSDMLKVSCFLADGYAGLSCFAISNESLAKGQIENCRRIFTKTPIRYPGFIEFDNANSRAVVFFTPGENYIVYSLDDYSPLFEIGSSGVADIKMTPGALMMIKINSLCRVNLQFHDISTGENKGEHSFEIDPHAEIQFIERCDLSIMYKQKNRQVISFDIATGSSIVIEETENTKTSDFLFLYNAKMVLLYSHGKYESFTFGGVKLFTISASEDLELVPVCVCPLQQYFLCTSNKVRKKIHMFSLADGTEIFSGEISQQLDGGFKLTALAYDNESSCIVCGNEVGTSHFWL